jgi:SAM-dependent methyltransferase
MGKALNSRVVGPLLVAFGLDYVASRFRNNWAGKKLDATKSLQQNMGFSHLPEVQDALGLVHSQIQAAYRTLCGNGAVLDVGCGVGLYLSDFPDGTDCHGIDVSADFVAAAKVRLPHASILQGDYLATSFLRRFGFIYSVGVLQYIPPSRIRALAGKLKADLEPGGVAALHYPHALSEMDCRKADLTYVLYSPNFLAREFGKAGFEVVSHVHAFDGRGMDVDFDTSRYDAEMARSVRNSALLVVRRK